MQELAEPRDDEERVVDADTQPDHRHEQRGDRVDVGEPRQEEEEEERGRNGRDGERERDRRRHERPEDDEQHDERREQAEQLLRSLLERRELRVAVELHLHTGGLDRFADSLLDGHDGLAILLVDHPVELGLRVRDAPVVGDRVLGERRLDALETRGVFGRRELGAAESRDRLVDRLLPLGGVEPLPGGAAKTTFSTPPCSSANSASMRSVALCVSDPGISNSSRSEPANEMVRTIRAAKMPSHAPMTRQGCVAQRRIQRARPPVESRSCAARRSSVISRPLVASVSE